MRLLTEKRKAIIRHLLKHEGKFITQNEMARLGLASAQPNAKKQLDALIEMGIIEIADKEKSRNVYSYKVNKKVLDKYLTL